MDAEHAEHPGNTDIPDQTDEQNRQQWVQETVSRYERQLMRYAWRQTGCVELAREIVQDTFLKLWQADRQQIEDHLAQWLYTVCRNRSLDVRTRERRMTTVETQTADARPGPDQSPDGSERDERRSALLREVQRLPERQQEAVRLKFQAGLSYKEIAAVLDVTVNHVGVILHTAMQALREAVQSHDDSGSVDRSDGKPSVQNNSTVDPEIAR